MNPYYSPELVTAAHQDMINRTARYRDRAAARRREKARRLTRKAEELTKRAAELVADLHR